MKKTEITTTARRIARACNQWPNHYTLVFDSEGHQLDVHERDLFYAFGHAPKGMRYEFGGSQNRHLTYAGVQEALDLEAEGIY